MADHAEAARKPVTTGAPGPVAVQRRGARGLEGTAETLNAGPAVAAQRALADRLSAAAPVQRAEAPKPNRTGLPNQLKAGIEALSGIAMDDVRVHRNSAAPAQLEAHAFAQGTDIHVAPGQDHHLPHEAWHVVQQKQGRVKATTQLKGVAVNDDSHLEDEADKMGAKALAVPAGHANNAEALAGASPAQRAAKTGRVVAAPAQRVAQLGKAKLSLRKKAKSRNGTFSGVSFKAFRRPASNSRKQGQHGSAYVSYQDMIRVRVIDKTPKQAVQSLLSLIPEIRKLINPRTTKPYLLTGLIDAQTLLNSANTFITAKDETTALSEMEEAIGTILTVRNQIPGTSTVTTNTGGHGEATSAGKLRVIEDKLRKKEDFPSDWGSEAAIAKEAGFAMWRLLDINPIKNRSADVIAAKLVEHEGQMESSYPKTHAWLGTRNAWHLSARVGSQEVGMPLKGMSDKKIREIKKAMKDL